MEGGPRNSDGDALFWYIYMRHRKMYSLKCDSLWSREELTAETWIQFLFCLFVFTKRLFLRVHQRWQKYSLLK